MMKAVALQSPPEWVNRRHEEIQRGISIKTEIDRHITHAYVADCGEMPGITIGDIIAGTAGAAVLYIGIALMFVALQ